MKTIVLPLMLLCVLLTLWSECNPSTFRRFMQCLRHKRPAWWHRYRPKFSWIGHGCSHGPACGTKNLPWWKVSTSRADMKSNGPHCKTFRLWFYTRAGAFFFDVG